MCLPFPFSLSQEKKTMKTHTFLHFAAILLSLYLTSCKVIYPPLRYETNLQEKIDPPNEESLAEFFGSDWAIANQIRETPAITTYFAPPNEPFELSVIADYLVLELIGFPRLFVNPAPASPNDKLYLSKLTLNKNSQLLVEIIDFGSVFSEDEDFSHSLQNLTAPAVTGNTDHYEFIGYWKDGKNRTLAQGIWVDVTAKEGTQGADSVPLKSNKPDIIRVHGGATLATKGGKHEYEFGEDSKSPFKPGFLLGASVPFRVSPRISVEAGIQVESKGAIEKYSYDDYEPGQGSRQGMASAAQLAASSFKNTTQLTYLGVPLLANVTPFPQLAGLGFTGGIQPSFLLGRKSKSSGFGSATTDKSKDGFNSVDLGLLIGAGYRLENGVGFRLAYEHGLADIMENEFETFKNRTIKLTATYDIPIHLISKK